jgi:divalent metal cation (Fe/Co/Zn/Cd) transporter
MAGLAVVLGAFTVMSWITGFFLGSLSLASAAFCTSYDVASLVISILSLVVSKQIPTKLYSYGFERAEVLLVFSCSCVMIFSGLYIIFEGFEHLFEGDFEELSSYLETKLFLTLVRLPMMFMSFIGCVLHIGTMLFFRDTIVIRSESVIQSSDRMNLKRFLTQHLLNIGSSFL